MFDAATNLFIRLVPNERTRRVLADVALGIVCGALALTLFFLALWAVVHAAGLDRG